MSDLPPLLSEPLTKTQVIPNEDVLQSVIPFLSDQCDISAFRLACRTFNNIGLRQHFSHIHLSNLKRTWALAALYATNKSLPTLATHLWIGTSHWRLIRVRADGPDGEENFFWDWLCSPKGLQLLTKFHNLAEIKLAQFTWRSPVDEKIEPKIKVFQALISRSQYISRLSLHGKCQFAATNDLIEFINTFKHIQFLELGAFEVLNKPLTTQLAMGDANEQMRTATPMITTPPLKSLRIIQYCDSEDYCKQISTVPKLYDTVYEWLTFTGGFRNLTSLTISASYLNWVALKIHTNLFNYVAPTLTDLSLYHIRNLPLDEPLLPQMRLLERLTLGSFVYSDRAWLARVLAPMLPSHRKLRNISFEFPSHAYIHGKDLVAYEEEASDPLDDLALRALDIDITVSIDITRQHAQQIRPLQDWRFVVTQQLMPQNFVRGAVNSVRINFRGDENEI